MANYKYILRHKYKTVGVNYYENNVNKSRLGQCKGAHYYDWGCSQKKKADREWLRTINNARRGIITYNSPGRPFRLLYHTSVVAYRPPTAVEWLAGIHRPLFTFVSCRNGCELSTSRLTFVNYTPFVRLVHHFYGVWTINFMLNGGVGKCAFICSFFTKALHFAKLL